MDYDRSCLEETRLAVMKFVMIYRETPHSALGGVAPIEAHRGITINYDRYLFETEEEIKTANQKKMETAFFKYEQRVTIY